MVFTLTYGAKNRARHGPCPSSPTMINKIRRFAWYIYLELLFFKLYVLVFKDLAATIVSIYWGHFLYYHSFIPLPTSLAKVVNLLLSSVHGSYIIAGQWHAPTKLTALPNYACFAVQRLIYIYYCVTDTQQLGCVLEGQREPQTRQPWRANQAALSPPSHHQYHKNFQLHIDCISFAREDRVPTISD